jgi:hypothetical protein
MSPVRYELEFYTPEDGFLHSHRCAKPHISLNINRLDYLAET